MKSIPQVQTLELQHTQCVDQVMAIVGCYCHELRSLNVCSCPVSDYGLMGLCLNLKDNSGQCQKLVRLLVADTHVTTEGAAFAVCYLPNLKEFDFDDMFSVLDVMHFGTNLTSKVLSHSTRYGISQLLSNNDKVSDARLRMAIALCPFVSKVSFQDVNMTDQTLQGLAGLEHLKELSLGNGIKSQITFTGGIGPLLREVGRRLDKLQLSNVADVDVITLGKYCSRLRHLTLIHNHNYKSIVTYREPVFSHLRILEIICNDHSDMMSVVLNRVLFNCHRLTSVELKRCGGLNDNFIREITTVNPLKDLRKFYLQECNEITAKAVLELFAQENNLASIRLWSCSNITEADYFQMIDRVKSENWDVTLDWIGYQ